MAYVLAHQYANKFERPKDARELLESAISMTQPDSDVARLAREALEKLDRTGKLQP